jgi:hypothetical protein
MYSIAAVIGAILVTIGIYLANLPSWVNFVSMVILLAVTVFGLKDWRNKYNGGAISFGKAMGYTTMLALFYCIAISIWTYIFYTYIGPDLLDKMRDEQIAKMIVKFKEMNIPEEQWSVSLGFTKRMFTPFLQSLSALVGGMFIYTIINLIVSAIMKKDPPPAEFTPNTSAS